MCLRLCGSKCASKNYEFAQFISTEQEMNESNMKWIVFVIILNLRKISGDISHEANTQIGNAKQPFYVIKSNNRSSRSTSVDNSNDSEDDATIHLHIWNDMNNRDNYYPNLMKQIANQSQALSTDTAIGSDDNAALNMMESLTPQQPTMDKLKNALMNTLDEYRKSDRDLYGIFYKLNPHRSRDKTKWNYYPSVVNYVPKTYQTNLNSATYGVQLSNTYAQTTSSPPLSLSTAIGTNTTARPSLYEQMQSSKNKIREYYTNLRKSKPKSVIDSIGYEIGGIPKYSGRLLANEPTPQQYRTFQLYEPVPRQVILPPPSSRIPAFKPVPPRLKIIPVIEEYLQNRPYYEPNRPIKVLRPDTTLRPIYRYPNGAPIQMLPFYPSEAMTVAPMRTFIPVTERYEWLAQRTEPNHRYRNRAISSDATLFRPRVSPTLASTTTAASLTMSVLPTTTTRSTVRHNPTYPSVVFAVTTNDSSTSMSSATFDGNSNNNVFVNDPEPLSHSNELEHVTVDGFGSEKSKKKIYHNSNGQNNNNNNENTFDSMKLVSATEQLRPTFHRHQLVQQQQLKQQQQQQQKQNQQQQKEFNFGNDIVDHTSKFELNHKYMAGHKRTTNNTRKFIRPSEIFNNNSHKLNLSDLRITGKDYNSIVNHRQNNVWKHGNEPESSNEKTIKSPKVKIIYGEHPSKDQIQHYSIDNHSSEAIQLSPTYSKRISNIRSNSESPNGTNTLSDQEKLLLQLTNDVSKALLTSPNPTASTKSNTKKSSNENSNEANSEEIGIGHDPFLISVLDDSGDSEIAKNSIRSDVRNVHDSTDVDRSDSITSIDDSRFEHRIDIDGNWSTNNRTDVSGNATAAYGSRGTERQRITLNLKPNSYKSNENNDKNISNNKYYNWYSNYAAEKNEKYGRKVISEHFKKVEVEPNIAWVIVPRKISKEKADRLRRNLPSTTAQPKSLSSVINAGVTHIIASSIAQMPKIDNSTITIGTRILVQK